MEERATFKFFRSFFEAAQALEMKSERADYYDAICGYVFYGEVPDLSGAPKAMFLLTKPNLDASLKRSQAGAIGGKASTKHPASKSEAKTKQAGSEAGRKKTEDRSRINTPLSPQGAPAGAFESFWAAYPKKVGKQAAKKAFDRVEIPVETLLAAIARQKCSAQWSKDNGRFIPNPASWLNQGRWEDELEQAGQDKNNDVYTLGESELRSIANLQRLRDTLAQGGAP